VTDARGTPPRRDRYGSLMESLRSGAEESRHAPAQRPLVPPRRGVSAVWRGWHPVARTFLVIAIAAAVIYGALLIGTGFLRSGRVDTWTGPDASVQSGLTLAGCPQVEGRGDAIFPSWIRYRGSVNASTGGLAPIGTTWQYGATRFAESEYRLGSTRLLLDGPLSGATTPETVLLLQEPARAVRRYDRTDCA